MSGCLLLTRQPAENQRLAARLAAHGVRTCSLPLLTLEPCAEGPAERQRMLDLDLYHAVVVVSPVAARLGLERLDHYWPQPPEGVVWLAVGGGTAQVLRDYGLPAQCPAQGQDSEALLAMPLWQPYRKHIEKSVGDLVNSAGLPGDLIYSALFLESFVEKSIDWVHLDCYAWEHSGCAGRPVGGADTGLLTVFKYIQERYA